LSGCGAINDDDNVDEDDDDNTGCSCRWG